jgi:hypothetical protein
MILYFDSKNKKLDYHFLKKYFLRKLNVVAWFSTHTSEILCKSSIACIFYFPITTEFEQSKAFINFEEKIHKTARGFSSLNSSVVTKKKLLERFNIVRLQ